MKAALLFILCVLHKATTVTVTSDKTTSYDAADLLTKIFKPNITIESRQRGYGFVKFEGQQDPGLDPESSDSGQYGIIDFERDQRPLRFEDDYDNQNNNPYENNAQTFDGQTPLKFENYEQNYNQVLSNGGVSFQDDNKVDDQGNKKKRKRRRRRKPKNVVLPYPGAKRLPPGRPGFEVPLQGVYGSNPTNTGYPGTRPFRRPRRPRPKPSFATEALSSVTEALTSIARYDDYQCVPRLLCEAAGGGALSNNGVLQSITGIQPLLSLLSAYNGLSTSPLFVFGRAVFLGMTSKGNTGTCRYAYPQCPTDPEQLIYYLNNHNGGFFRFFNAPQLPNQNVEQFYNQLSQGYGIYQPNPAQENYGNPSDANYDQSYGFYSESQNQVYPRPHDNENYGQNNDADRPELYDRPGLYSNQNYGSNYAYDYNNYGPGNQIRFKDNNAKIEKRIQNKPLRNIAENSFEDNDIKTKWQFPDDLPENENSYDYNIRDIRTLKFPEENQSYNDKNNLNRKGKQSYFPQSQNYQTNYNNRPHTFSNNNRYETTTNSYSYSNNGQNNQNYYTNRPNINYNNHKPATKYHNYDYNHKNNNNANNQNYYNNGQNMYSNNNYKYPTTTYNNEDYVFDHKHNFYVKKENYSPSNKVFDGDNNFKRKEYDGYKTVYVVRGNGDPNNPEIVKLRPGQSVH